MTIIFVTKSGNELKVKCTDAEFTRDRLTGRVTSVDMEGITENKPIDVDMKNIDFIYRVYSDEQGE